MKLNLYVLQEEYPELNLRGILYDPPSAAGCIQPRLCDRLPREPDTQYLYLIAADTLGELPVLPEHLSILCIGKPGDAWLHAKVNLLYTEMPVTLNTLANMVSETYYRYAAWEESLQEAVDENLLFVEFARRSRQFLHNDVMGILTGYRVFFFYSPPKEGKSAVAWDIASPETNPDDMILSSEDINLLETDPEYQQAIDSTEPTIYTGSAFGYRTLYYNIRINGVCVGRICLDEKDAPITGRDYLTVRVLGAYVKKKLARDKIYEFNRPKDLDMILTYLLDHHFLPEQRIQAILNSYGWHMDDQYICLIIRTVAGHHADAALNAFAMSLSQETRSDCYTIYHNSIIYIYNLSARDKNKAAFAASILPLLRDNLMTACFSSVYTDFKNLYYYYHQALDIQALARKKDPTKWYVQAEDYQLEHFLSQSTRNTLTEVYVPDGLKRLMDYDRKKGSNYTRLLYIFLQNERNIAKTIRVMYIHRNTFLYRIRRIQQILGMDLELPRTRLLLWNALQIIYGEE